MASVSPASELAGGYVACLVCGTASGDVSQGWVAGMRDWKHIQAFEKVSADGQGSELDEVRTPAVFYRLRVIGDRDSVDNFMPGYILYTATGEEMHQFIVTYAEHVAQGALRLNRIPS